MKNALKIHRPHGASFAVGIGIFLLSFALVQCTSSPREKAGESAQTMTDTTTLPPAPEETAQAEPSAPAPAETPAPEIKPPTPATTPKTVTKPKATVTNIKAEPAPQAQAPAAVPKAEPKFRTPAIPKEEPPTEIPEEIARPQAAKAVTEVVNFSVKSIKGTVAGTSTLHPWESQITRIACKGAFKSVNKEIESVMDVEVKIPVESIKSTEGNIMDNKTYETFKSDKFPNIVYTFKSEKVNIDARQAVVIHISGNLTMAGKTKTVKLTANGKVLPNGDLQLSVSQQLKMSDFEMKPPKIMFGTVKVGDEITVNFDLVLTRANL